MQQPYRGGRRTLTDVPFVDLTAVHKGAIVVRRRDAEGAPRQLPARPAERGHRERELPVGAAEEAVELRARIEQVEVDVAEAGKRQRDRDVRIDDDAGNQRTHAVGL